MSKNSQIRIAVNLISEHQAMFRCPLCSSPFRLVNLKSLICSNGHCFDLSKQGYVNFLTRPLQSNYNKSMFSSRNVICKSGFFEPLTDQISKMMIEALGPNREPVKVLDAGCGEGSLLSSIHQKADSLTDHFILGTGMDISKEGIYPASVHYPHMIWCVADMAKIPFNDQQFHFILNILSPANYSEFGRILLDQGLIIKVIPQRDYLMELRKLFYAQTGKEVYSNHNTLDLFRNNLEFLELQPLRYTLALDGPLIGHLVRMTPLAWGAGERDIQRALSMESLEITVDLAILLGRKRKGSL